MYKVVLMGASLDTGNMGVSSLAVSFAKIVMTIHPDAELYFFTGNRSNKPQQIMVSGRSITIRVLNHRLSPRAKYNEHLFWLFLMHNLRLCYIGLDYTKVSQICHISAPALPRLRYILSGK